MESQGFSSGSQVLNGAKPGAQTSRNQTLESLSLLDLDELGVLYGQATAGRLSDVEGHPRGRMLAVPGLTAPGLFGIARWYARSRFMVWEGKSFVSVKGSPEGRGFNRVRFFGRRRAFRFRTLETASIVDGLPCLAIAYDVPENPGFVHAVYDELRHLGNGVFLGRGMRRRSGDAPALLVWFALDTRHQDSEPRV